MLISLAGGCLFPWLGGAYFPGWGVLISLAGGCLFPWLGGAYFPGWGVLISLAGVALISEVEGDLECPWV